MLTTVTTTTAMLMTSATTPSLVLIAVLTLLALLVQKEVLGSFKSVRTKRSSKSLNIAIVPLLIVFVANLLFRLISLLHS